jgi:arylsulfatase A-like enzyme
MIVAFGEFQETALAGSSRASRYATRPRLASLIFLAIWCGLVAGLLEVGTIVLRKHTVDPDRLYNMSRHFLWLVPLTNVGLFVAMGLMFCIATMGWLPGGRRLAARLVCSLVPLPTLLVAFPRVYGLALLCLALGVGARLLPVLERHSGGLERFVRTTLPVFTIVVLIFGASLWVSDRIKKSRENGRSLPSPGSPNVLLIVMDTVAAGHLSLYGYERDTSTTLVELAERGIRFDSAQAAASWTLPSHATMFTGRWLHELSVGWLNPLDDARPTLAEYLGTRGYATAGFIANTAYCASDSGLDRGFAEYRDFIFPKLTASKTSVMVSRALKGIKATVQFLDDQQEFIRLRRFVAAPWRLFEGERKDAAVVNREFLDWLSRRTQPERPFFAFLNYGDAHAPYRLPSGRMRRFGAEPTDDRQLGLIEQWAEMDTRLASAQQVAYVANAYDDCVADLDEQIGKLLDELRRRVVLDRTWLIVTADHGESFGEHDGVFLHGTSLYQTELHVPLLIVPPGGGADKQVVKEAVTLRDLATTIVDVLDFESGTPFPGGSLARFWNENAANAPHPPYSSDPALAEVVPGDPLKRDSYGLFEKTWPMGAVKTDEWSYIRREGDVREELFHIGEDLNEQRNLADDPAARSILEQMRRSLGQLTGGPLLPKRFNR